jgi:hypothetical protein
MNYLGIFFQLVAAIAIVIAFNRGAHWVMASQKVVVDYNMQVTTAIFKGWISAISFTNRTYNSFNEFSINYRDLPRSVNRSGGSQFSFSIWTRFDDTSAINLKNKVIFLYGDPNKYTVTRDIKEPEDRGGQVHSETITDFIIKCPLVMFSEDGTALNMQFNTNENIQNTVVVQKVRSTNEARRHNVMSMMPGKWALWSFVFSEDMNRGASGEGDAGIKVQMYVNDFLHHTEKVRGSMRLNKGYVMVLPEPIKHAFLADFSYHNWALTQTDVVRIVKRGVSSKAFNEMDSDGGFSAPNYLTEYNKLEIYNL